VTQPRRTLTFGWVAPMSRILVTGMSGTGKSSALEELGRRGFRVIDTDDPGWRQYRARLGRPRLGWNGRNRPI
jgi:predicted ATPase